MQDNNPVVNNSNQAPITTPPTPTPVPAPTPVTPVVPAFQEPSVVQAPPVAQVVMEPPLEPKKNSPLVKIAIILIVLALLGAGGYFGYQTFMNKNITPEEVSEKNETSQIDENVSPVIETLPTEIPASESSNLVPASPENLP